jgi:hypothetical protein
MTEKSDSDPLLKSLRAAFSAVHERKKERRLKRIADFFRRKKPSPENKPPKKEDAA